MSESELLEGLRQRKPLIPVLIADTAMPGPDELPEALAAIAFLNALRIHPDPDFHADSDRLVEAVTERMSENSPAWSRINGVGLH